MKVDSGLLFWATLYM